jgi:hypothetical protein
VHLVGFDYKEYYKLILSHPVVYNVHEKYKQKGLLQAV